MNSQFAIVQSALRDAVSKHIARLFDVLITEGIDDTEAAKRFGGGLKNIIRAYDEAMQATQEALGEN